MGAEQPTPESEGGLPLRRWRFRRDGDAMGFVLSDSVLISNSARHGETSRGVPEAVELINGADLARHIPVRRVENSPR